MGMSRHRAEKGQRFVLRASTLRAAGGCGNVNQRIAEIEARHGVTLDVSDGARLQDLFGGSAYLTVDNIGKELAVFPPLATQSRRIHVAPTGDLLAKAYPAEFDADGDGRLTYDDARRRTALAHSLRSGADPLTQVEMTAGMVGYRPHGFASPYGRTSPWEDKAEVLDYAVRKRMLPHLVAAPDAHNGLTEQSFAEATKRLADLRKWDKVLARKIEIVAVFLVLCRRQNDGLLKVSLPMG